MPSSSRLRTGIFPIRLSICRNRNSTTCASISCVGLASERLPEANTRRSGPSIENAVVLHVARAELEHRLGAVVADLVASGEGIEGAARERERRHGGQHAADLAVVSARGEQAAHVLRAGHARREIPLEGAREIDASGREVRRELELLREARHVAVRRCVNETRYGTLPV